MKTTPIDHGYYLISRASARSFGPLPRAGTERLVATDAIPTTHGYAWLSQTRHNGRMVWSLRDTWWMK